MLSCLPWTPLTRGAWGFIFSAMPLFLQGLSSDAQLLERHKSLRQAWASPSLDRVQCSEGALWRKGHTLPPIKLKQ